MLKQLSSFLNAGTELTTDHLLQKKVMLSNFMGMLIGSTAVPFIFIFYYFGSQGFGGATVLNSILFFSVVYFNKRGDFDLARNLLLVTWGIGVFVYCLYLGKETGLQSCFFTLVAAPFILFKPDEKWKVLHIAIPILGYFIVEYDVFSGIETIGLSSDDSAAIKRFVNPIVLLQIVLILYYYGSHERALVKELKESNLLMKSLKKQKRHLIEKSDAVQKSEEELSELLKSLDDVVLEINDQGIILNFWTSRNKLNIEINQPVRKYFGEFLEDTVDAAFELFGDNYFNKVHEYKLGDKFYQFKITPMSKMSGFSQMAVVVVRDITIHKQVLEEFNSIKKEKEIAVEASKFKESFLANMSHEIRTPLNGVVGMIDLLSSTELNKVQQDYLDTLKSSSDNLLSLINDILDLSKIEAGKMSLQPKRFNIHQLIENVGDLYRPMAKSSGLTITLLVDEKLPKYIQADPTRISQVLTNLVSNAIKFTAEGGITIKVTLKAVNEVLFQVIDTGEGIEEQQKNTLFKKFVQHKQNSNSKVIGSGLGLSIVKELVVLMGGKVKVESEVGKGSIFSFNLFFEETVQNKRNDNKIIKGAQEVKPLKVLLVDDILLNRKVANIMLSKLSCNVVEATNGKEAVQFAKDEDFDLILMDIMMPVMDGVSAMEIIKENKKHPPIIALSANAMEGDKERYLELGFSDYIPKPVTLKVLKEHLILNS